MSEETEAAEAVARGAQLLDEIRPGWLDEIELSILDIYSGSECVIGQLWGDYLDYRRMVLGGTPEAQQAGAAEGDLAAVEWGLIAGMYGFVATGTNGHNEYADKSRRLTQAWREEITRRRTAA